ncbi:hypothetical protein Taro_013087, partial [Colocasia esculenta]|nr:hypothetical protein [Colocasia esculenta]
ENKGILPILVDMVAATLQRVVYKVDPIREDAHEEQSKELHYVADPTLIEKYEEQMKEIHYVADPALDDEYYRQIELELSEADEDIPAEKTIYVIFPPDWGIPTIFPIPEGISAISGQQGYFCDFCTLHGFPEVGYLRLGFLDQRWVPPVGCLVDRRWGASG